MSQIKKEKVTRSMFEQRISSLQRQLHEVRNHLGMTDITDKPKPKVLDQSVFDGQDENRRFFAIDENGEGWFYRGRPEIAFEGKRWLEPNHTPVKLADGYDIANWQNSLIERKAELTGSDLCKAMFEHGDKHVMCFISDLDETDAIESGVSDVVIGVDLCFETHGSNWSYAVPINNQGEPLTQAEAGL